MHYDIHTHTKKNSGIEILNTDLQFIPVALHSVGIHPWSANIDQLALVQHKSSSPNCLAIGEIGLDKVKGPDLEQQEQCFLKQIEISETRNLPVIIHCVKAWNELQAIKRRLKPKQVWIYHGFTKANLVEDVLNEGLYISIGSSILTNNTLQKALERIPKNRLFIETDDSTASIELIYQKISEIKKISLRDLEDQLEANFKQVFTKWKTG